MKGKDKFRRLSPTTVRGLVSADPPRRRWSLSRARWVLITVCALLILNHPQSAGILAPLLMLAVFLGGRRERVEAAATRSTRELRDVQPHIVYH